MNFEIMGLTPIQQEAFESLTGITFLTKEEEEYFKKIHSIEFLEFLFDHMNPNEMEDYISMYLSTREGYKEGIKSKLIEN